MSSGLNPHSEQEVVPQCQTTKESEAASFDKVEETGSDYIVRSCTSFCYKYFWVV